MKFATLVKRSLLMYPTLYRTPADVAHSLFFGVGTGYFWHKGELVGPPIPAGIKCTVHVNERLHRQLQAATDDRERFHYERQQHDYKFLTANIDRVMKYDAGEMSKGILWWSEAAPIQHVPKDVKEDWLRAAYDHAFLLQRKLAKLSYDKASDKADFEKGLPSLIDKLDDMLVARGLFCNKEQRKKNMKEILDLLGLAKVAA